MSLSRPRTLTVSAFKQIRSLPPLLRATAEGLRMHADDEGRGLVELRQILADVYPNESTVTESVLVDHLLELAEAGVIVLYEDSRSRSCYEFTMWGRVDRPAESKIDPAPAHAREAFASDSRDSREECLAGESERERERESGRESAGEGERGGEREDRSRLPREGLPPDPFCREHPGGVDYPCIDCQNARLHNQHFKDRVRWETRRRVRGVRFEGGDDD